MHNRLEEVKAVWRPYRSGGLQGFVSNLFFAPKDNNALLRAYCSFTSDEEVPPAYFADSLPDLCKWVIVRKYAFHCLFEGVLNIKGENHIYIWKRRYVKWYGYTLYVFDIHTNKMVGQIFLGDATPSLDLVKNRILKFIIGNEEIKVHCDTPESLLKCMEAAYIIFPKILDWL